VFWPNKGEEYMATKSLVYMLLALALGIVVYLIVAGLKDALLK